jgi:hypothetical protein
VVGLGLASRRRLKISVRLVLLIGDRDSGRKISPQMNANMQADKADKADKKTEGVCPQIYAD